MLLPFFPFLLLPFFMYWERRSMGRGKMMVEFFSALMALSVCM